MPNTRHRKLRSKPSKKRHNEEHVDCCLLSSSNSFVLVLSSVSSSDSFSSLFLPFLWFNSDFEIILRSGTVSRKVVSGSLKQTLSFSLSKECLVQWNWESNYHISEQLSKG